MLHPIDAADFERFQLILKAEVGNVTFSFKLREI